MLVRPGVALAADTSLTLRSINAWAYYPAMLSAAGAAALLFLLAGSGAQDQALLSDMLLRVALLLGALNLVGAVAIFSPIRRFLAGNRAGRDAAARRVSALPALSGLWIGLLAAAAMLSRFTLAYGSWQALLGSDARSLSVTLVYVVGFGVYLGLCAHFLVAEYTVWLRGRLWRAGEAFAARPGKLVHRLVAALIAVALAPFLVILADRSRQPEMPMMMGMSHSAYMHQTLEMNIFAALLLAGMVIWLVARGLARPVQVLLGAMQRVDRGDLGTKAPVVSDDELGLLTEQFNRMLEGLKERERIRRTFARFVPESVAATLLAKDGSIASQEREASVFFVDIENFTAIASGLTPREVMQMLNDYFTEAAHIIHTRSGVITQFQGDAVLACFNLPVTDPDHARHAMEAALALHALLVRATFAGGVKLRARVGIATGTVVGGTVGGEDRLGYTLHGDTVNLAARLEEMNKVFGSRILVSSRTAELLGGSGVPLRDRGVVAVRGFSRPHRVFEASTAADVRNRNERSRS